MKQNVHRQMNQCAHSMYLDTSSSLYLSNHRPQRSVAMRFERSRNTCGESWSRTTGGDATDDRGGMDRAHCSSVASYLPTLPECTKANTIDEPVQACAQIRTHTHTHGRMPMVNDGEHSGEYSGGACKEGDGDAVEHQHQDRRDRHERRQNQQRQIRHHLRSVLIHAHA